MKDYLTLSFGLIISFLVPGAILAWGLLPYITIVELPWPRGNFENVFSIVLLTCGCGALAGGIRAITLDSWRRRRLRFPRFGKSPYPTVKENQTDIKADESKTGSTNIAMRIIKNILSLINGSPQTAASSDWDPYHPEVLPKYLDLSSLGISGDKLKGYEILAEEYMRYYNFFGNLVIALPLAFFLRKTYEMWSLHSKFCLEILSNRLEIVVWMVIWTICWNCAKLYWRFFRTAAVEILYGEIKTKPKIDCF